MLSHDVSTDGGAETCTLGRKRSGDFKAGSSFICLLVSILVLVCFVICITTFLVLLYNQLQKYVLSTKEA